MRVTHHRPPGGQRLRLERLGFLPPSQGDSLFEDDLELHVPKSFRAHLLKLMEHANHGVGGPLPFERQRPVELGLPVPASN
jgi:hypothetical protein